jgi:hypothetical protein
MKTIEILNKLELIQVRGGGDDDDAPGEPVKDGSLV